MSPKRSNRNSQSRYSQQAVHNGNLQVNSTKDNNRVPAQQLQVVKAQTLFGLKAVYTVHRDKSKVQRYSPPPVEDTGEFYFDFG